MSVAINITTLMFFVLIFLRSISLPFCQATIDINAAELQYLADHLTPEECRRLVAAAHFNRYNEPNALDKLERKVPKEISCLEHLYHWNSEEGKGQTHAVLEHRLRQMGKIELADWLGRTVFHEIGVDLDKSIKEGLTEELTSDAEAGTEVVTVEPLVPKIDNPSDFSLFDYILYAFAVGLLLTMFGLCFKVACDSCREKIRKRFSLNDENKCGLWVKQMHLADWTPTKNSRICSRYFENHFISFHHLGN